MAVVGIGSWCSMLGRPSSGLVRWTAAASRGRGGGRCLRVLACLGCRGAGGAGSSRNRRKRRRRGLVMSAGCPGAPPGTAVARRVGSCAPRMPTSGGSRVLSGPLPLQGQPPRCRGGAPVVHGDGGSHGKFLKKKKKKRGGGGETFSSIANRLARFPFLLYDRMAGFWFDRLRPLRSAQRPPWPLALRFPCLRLVRARLDEHLRTWGWACGRPPPAGSMSSRRRPGPNPGGTAPCRRWRA